MEDARLRLAGSEIVLQHGAAQAPVYVAEIDHILTRESGLRRQASRNGDRTKSISPCAR